MKDGGKDTIQLKSVALDGIGWRRVVAASHVRRVGLQDGSGMEMTDDGRTRYRGFPLVSSQRNTHFGQMLTHLLPFEVNSWSARLMQIKQSAVFGLFQSKNSQLLELGVMNNPVQKLCFDITLSSSLFKKYALQSYLAEGKEK